MHENLNNIQTSERRGNSVTDFPTPLAPDDQELFWDSDEDEEVFDILEMRVDSPQEIADAIQDARIEYPHRRVVALFQPYGAKRTQPLLDKLGEALAQADALLVVELDPGDENISDAPDVPVIAIVEKATARNPELTGAFLSERDKVPVMLQALTQPNDVVLIIGMGDFEAQPMAFAQSWIDAPFGEESETDSE